MIARSIISKLSVRQEDEQKRKCAQIKAHPFILFVLFCHTKKNPACRQAGKKGQGIRQLADCRATALQFSY